MRHYARAAVWSSHFLIYLFFFPNRNSSGTVFPMDAAVAVFLWQKLRHKTWNCLPGKQFHGPPGLSAAWSTIPVVRESFGLHLFN